MFMCQCRRNMNKGPHLELIYVIQTQILVFYPFNELKRVFYVNILDKYLLTTGSLYRRRPMHH